MRRALLPLAALIAVLAFLALQPLRVEAGTNGAAADAQIANQDEEQDLIEDSDTEDSDTEDSDASGTRTDAAEKSGGWNIFKRGKTAPSKKKPGKLPPRPEAQSKDSREAAADILREMTQRR